MSAASTQIYYRELCRLTRESLGGLHSPELLIRSVDFDEIERLQASSEWGAAAKILNEKAIALERGGADILIMATNTMHKVADQILSGVSIPFLHIADATAKAILERGFRRPGLMATAFTMEQNFYVDRLVAQGLLPLILRITIGWKPIASSMTNFVAMLSERKAAWRMNELRGG